uniref:Oligosaccharyltransferase complex subunit n=1 Tax=Junco hyemalis TaxID=40217 RepID=A0A8C5IMM0_JUNHY
MGTHPIVRPRGIPAPRSPANTGTGIKSHYGTWSARRVCSSPGRLCKLTRGTWLFLPPLENCISSGVSKGCSTPWQGRPERPESDQRAVMSHPRPGPVVPGTHAGPEAATWLPSPGAGPAHGHAPSPAPARSRYPAPTRQGCRVLAGIIYDVIVEPPSVGSMTDEHGHQRPVAFLAYRVNGQYIMEGLASSFLFTMGGLGFIILDRSNAPNIPKLNRFLLLFIGFVSVLLSFFMARVFMRMKLPGYLMG